ncbi:MAG: hypothetical protein N2690_07215 [Rhodocyclaceae bacterium]|nr:hypothetical protein [Rhodocyclaceae bacterium]
MQQLDMPRRPYQQQLQNLMRCCRQQRQPVSARGWYLQHRADMGGISLGSWLAYVLLYCRAAKNIHAKPYQRDKGGKRVIINVLADIVVQAYEPAQIKDASARAAQSAHAVSS